VLSIRELRRFVPRLNRLFESRVEQLTLVVTVTSLPGGSRTAALT
jgi:hypothetical protein